jgi:lambda family phage tail tape measure protein
MSDLRYSASLDTTQAERNLDRFQKAVVNVNDTFIRFRNTIATISLGAFLQQTINSAARLDALSKSTGIAADTLKGFGDAVRAGGGNADQAADAISDLVKNIGDAATGGGELVKAFAKAGVSFQELRTASEEDILRKTIDGIAKIGDNATQSAVKAKIFGEALKTVDLKTVNGGLNEFIANARGYGAEAKAAADAQRQFATAVDKLQTVVLKVSKPLLDLVNAINLTSAAVSKFFAVLGEALTFAAYAAGILLIGKAILFIASAGLIAIAGIRTLGTGIAGLFKVLTTPLLRADLFKNLAMLSPGMASRVKAVSEAIGVPIAWLAANWGKLAIAVGAGIGALKEYFGLGKTPEVPTVATPDGGPETVTDRGLEGDIQRAAKFQAALAAQQQAYNKLNSEAQTFSNYLLADLKFQTSLLGMTEDQKEIATALNGETTRYLDQQNQLQSKLSDIQSQIGIELKSQRLLTGAELAASKDKVSLLVEEEDRLKALSNTYYDLHISNGKNLESELKQQQRIKNAEAERLSNLEYISERLREQAASYESLGGALRSINDKRVDLKVQTDQTGLSPLRKQIATINEEARKAALEAGRAFGSTFESEDGLTPERAEELAAGLGQIAMAYKAIADEQIKALGVSEQYLSGNLDSLSAWREEFNIGTKNAFDKFKEDALDAGKQAADGFSTFTSGMEDAFVQFVQTGKLSFKSLANSIIADLVRIAVRRAIVAAIGGPLGSLFGMANGGPVQGSTPIIVGERGPELFVPQSAGKIISNSALKGSGSNTGGTIGGGQTMVTYNIQAVDAASFRSLVARDPSFIYAVTEQGRRSQPTRSR